MWRIHVFFRQTDGEPYHFSQTHLPHITLPRTNNQQEPTKDLAFKEEQQLTLQSSAFEALEADFQEVLNELVGDKSLERFRLEYEKLHHALKKSHEYEKQLISKCRELNQEIVSNASKVQSALRMSRNDQNNITLLKKEIENAWKIVDAAQEKEKRARETITKLKGEIEKLTRIVDQGAGLSMNQENALNELMEDKARLLKEVEGLTMSLESEQLKTSQLVENNKGLEQEKFDIDRQLHECKAQITQLSTKHERETRKSERLTAEMTTLKDINDARKDQLGRKNEEVEGLKEDMNQLILQKREVEYALDKYRDVAEELRLKNDELERTVSDHQETATRILSDKDSMEGQMKTMKEDVKKIQNQLQIEKRSKQKLKAEKDRLAFQKLEAEKVKDELRNEMVNVFKELELQSRNADADEKLIKDLQNHAKKLMASLGASREKNKMQMGIVQNHEEVRKALEQDIVRHKTEEERLRRRNYELEKQREKAAMNASTWHAKHQEALEQAKIKEMEQNEVAKKLQEEKTKLKLQQALYEQVRADRNLFSKQHIQSQDEIAEMKRKFKIMTHQIEQLKEEIQTKDHALINEHFAFKRLKDEMKVLKRKLAKREEVLQTADQVLKSQDSEVKNLRHTLQEAEQAQRLQKQVYDDVVQERDILGSQLVRRNDELALLYEKIRILQSTLSKGEIQYRERLDEIKMMNLQVTDMKRELSIRTNEGATIDALKNEVHVTQKELLQERTKVKALSEELENPMNVHRWRKLEGSDPKKFELIQKIQTLQKRLIEKTEDVVEKDLLLQEKERLYQELKNILARQPGPEVAEQLSIYQQNLKEKTRQMKAMAAELNMLQAQCNDYKYEVERVNRDLKDTKKKYFDQRRKEQAIKDAIRGENPTNDPLTVQQHQFHTKQSKITGGGFNLSNPGTSCSSGSIGNAGASPVATS